jgi:hypothetical protein
MQHVLAASEYFATEVVVGLHFLGCIGTPSSLLAKYIPVLRVFAVLAQHVSAGVSSWQQLYTLFCVKALLAVLTQHVLAGAEYFATEEVAVLHFVFCTKAPNVSLTQHTLAGAEYVRRTGPACSCWC